MRSLVPRTSFEHALQGILPPPDYLAMPAAGVDISNSAVKVLAMYHGMPERGVRFFDTVLLPPNVIENGDVLEKGALVQTLRELKKKRGFSCVHVALPEKRAFIFETSVPKNISREETRVVLESKLEEHVPLSPAEALFDFEYVGGDRGSAEDRLVVSVYARRVVDGYLAAFFEAGLTVLSLEIESQAIARSTIDIHDTRTHFIVDFGRTSTKLAIARNALIVYSSTVEIGGDAITEAVMKYRKVSREEADRIKNEQGFYQQADDQGLSEAMMSTVSALTEEIRKRFLYWKDRQGHEGDSVPAIDTIILCGGNANLKGFADFLGRSLDVPVELANVWTNTPSLFRNGVPPIPKAHSLEYATTLGLALRGHLS